MTFKQTTLTVIVFKLQVILLIMEGTEKSESSHYSLSYWNRLQVTHFVVVMENKIEQHILTTCSKRNTFQVISDLLHDFMNFNAVKLF